MHPRSDDYILEKVETQLRGESTRRVAISQAPRELNKLKHLSTFQLKILFESLMDQEFIVGAPLGDLWGPAAIEEKRDKSYLVQWVKEGLDASHRWHTDRYYHRV